MQLIHFLPLRMRGWDKVIIWRRKLQNCFPWDHVADRGDICRICMTVFTANVHCLCRLICALTSQEYLELISFLKFTWKLREIRIDFPDRDTTASFGGSEVIFVASSKYQHYLELEMCFVCAQFWNNCLNESFLIFSEGRTYFCK